MRSGKIKKRSSFNPFISLTDVLFNLVLVLIFASAFFIQDINQKYNENEAFKNRLASLQLERDKLIDSVKDLNSELDNANALQDELEGINTSLEEQIGVLVSNLDSAQAFQQALAERITVLLGEVNDKDLQNQLLEEKITVIIGDLEVAEGARKLLEDEITLTLGNLEEAEQTADSLRTQVSELSRNNFLVVELEWQTESHDLDLHVTDPKGNRFFWNQATYPDESSRLTLDNRIGARPNKPGLEIWTARDIEPGTYRIEVGLWGCDRLTDASGYRPCQTDGQASLLIRHRDGDDLISNIVIPANQSYADINGNDFTLNETLFDRLSLVANVEVFEENGEIRLEVKPANGLTLTRLDNQN
ncbi:MAG: hypothetical protein KC422_16955 [Trueperaceae bacterium]|nr:hypothetical protein [Trueperaceae bacterium]